MKTLTLLIILFASFPAFAQDIPLDDVKAIRKLAADRDFWKASYEESERQKAAFAKSAADWKALAQSETDRADRVQGGRINESLGAVTELQKANRELHAQAERDRQKIGELTAENESLRGGRKWYFGAGAVTGFVAGWWLKGKSANFTNPFTTLSEGQRTVLKPVWER